MMEKIFYSIGEVAGMFHMNESSLRYWEKMFPKMIHPGKTDKGTRQYRKEDIEAIRLIHYLLKEKGLTISGARKKLRENKEDTCRTEEIVYKLKEIKEELNFLKNEFDELEKTGAFG